MKTNIQTNQNPIEDNNNMKEIYCWLENAEKEQEGLDESVISIKRNDSTCEEINLSPR